MANQIGVIGIGTMGRNLVLNMADKGYSVAGFDKNSDQVNLLNQEEHSKAKGFASLLL